MRIAQITATFPPYWGGTGNVAYHNARLLHERGHEVTVFTATPGKDELDFPFNVERLPVWFRIGNAPLTPGLLRGLKDFDLMHLHYPFIFGAELVLAAKLVYGLPLVLTYHNQLLDRTGIKRLLFGCYNVVLEPLILSAARYWLAVSRDHFESVQPRQAASSKLLELSNGVDTALFKGVDQDKARTELKLPLHSPILLFVGALDRAHRFKNVDGLLIAFSRLGLPAARLLIVGDGDLRADLEDLASTLGISESVVFLRQRTPKTLPLIYSAADVTVLPSTGPESFGMVLIESMACGTPVVASDLPGVRTVVEDGVDGKLVSVGDGPALESALRQILLSSDRVVMGEAGRQKVNARYDWQVIGAKLEQFYHQVLYEH